VSFIFLSSRIFPSYESAIAISDRVSVSLNAAHSARCPHAGAQAQASKKLNYIPRRQPSYAACLMERHGEAEIIAAGPMNGANPPTADSPSPRG
jgi:hypothetical protein